MDIDSIAETPAPKKAAEKKPLHERLESYRHWLLGLKICDPACGSGAFLNQAFDFLIGEHGSIDELHKHVEFGKGNAFTFADVETAILENNLYGVDINEESVEIAKLSLWLRSAEKGRKLNDLSNRIKLGNSLIDDPAIAGEKAFNWKKNFPEVFENGGFDVIIGNPPYVVLTPADLEGYRLTQGNYNTYVAFIEKSLALVKDKNYIGFIIPTTWFSGDNYIALRNNLLDTHSILCLIQLPYDIFAAYIDTTIMVVQSKGDEQETLTHKYSIRHQAGDIDISKFENFSTTIWKKYGKIFLDKGLLRISEKVWFSPMNIKLGSIANVNRGTLPPQPEQLSSQKDATHTLRWFDNQVFRYTEEKQSNTVFYVDYSSLKENKPIELFKTTKILARQLVSRQFRINMTLTHEEFAFKKNLYAIYNFSSDFSVHYLLSILNSRLFSYCQVNFNASLQRDDFPAFSLNDFREFLIPKISLSSQKPFVVLAEKILSLASDLQLHRRRFLDSLADNFSGVKISEGLKNFSALTFTEFLSEMTKQKHRIPVHLQSEWKQFFTKAADYCRTLSSSIAATDAEIDRLVYGIYGLTDEEIKIVEGL